MVMVVTDEPLNNVENIGQFKSSRTSAVVCSWFFDPKPKTSSLSGVINKPRDMGNVTQYEWVLILLIK